MLELNGITKIYEMADMKVEALKGINLKFRRNEFVSILGPSGCGKTTLLNIVGGLDRYTEGDLVINGVSTKEYKDKEWDTYRNHSVGFVFQSYNLIPHQTVLENVEIALTLSGVSKEERKQRAIDVLKRVGLADKLKSKPNQLSGGQMQRVAIARALVNDPEIILADEPTGALDTVTSVQIMEILKEISKDKLIVMVTHNPELAETYSTRIVKLLDGNVIDDSNPYKGETEKQREVAQEKLAKKGKKKNMSFFTALFLSFKNLLTKKGRTILVAFAGSIGIIGIALILAISSGFSTYVNKMQEDTLSTYPITIQAKKVDFASIMTEMFMSNAADDNVDHKLDGVYAKENISKVISSVGNSMGTNNLEKFYDYIDENYDDLKDYVNAVQYTYNLDLEYYISADEQLANPADIVNVEPNSNAVMQMVIIYSLYYFEDKTDITFAKEDDGSYTLYRPATFGEYITDENLLKERYSFIYNNKYTELEYIARDLEKPENNGQIKLSTMKVLNLVFSIMDIDMDTTSMMGSSSSMFGGMSIFSEMIDNSEFIKSQYTLLDGDYLQNTEEAYNEAILVLDKNNELDDYILYALGIMSDEKMEALLKGMVTGDKVNTLINYSDILGREYKILDESDYYLEDGTDFRIYNQQTLVDGKNVVPNPDYNIGLYYTHLMNAYNNCTNKLKIVGIVRLNDSTKNGSMSAGVVYSKHFTEHMIDYRNAKIESFAEKPDTLLPIDKGVPSSISLFIKSFDSKDGVKAFIEKYNDQADKNDKISYTDYIDVIMSSVSTIINAITYILIAFVSVSLVVSSIMIGIITYISVIERTKEIGVLRSVGASKRDIKRVFTAESFIIGLASGLFGIGISLLLTIPINLVLKHFTSIAGLASLPWLGSTILVVISIVLTLISGLIPARVAAKKDPVVALRSN